MEKGQEHRTNIIEMKILCGLFVVLLLFSCGKEEVKPEFSCGEEISLMNDIMPIVSNNCIGCHDDGPMPHLTSKQAVIDNADDIRREVSGGLMPPPSASPLEAEDVQLIKCWVDDGAPDN